EIEAAPRGILSGSVGYFSLDGAADFNVCVRTIVIEGDQASTASADSIVALSSPAAEIKDLMRKEEGLRTALLSEAPLEFETVNIDAPIQASAE
uniref:chorismate-binding protein n=1 Tax=Henriciella pelagia TaxID=1977912 RepID=UPI0035190AD8